MTLTEWPDVAAPASPVPVSRETITVSLPPLDEVARRWHEIEPLLDRATRRTGCYEPIDLLMLAMAGRAAIWLCRREDEEILAVLVSQVTVYPRRRVLEMMFAGGGNMAEWREIAVQTLDRHAREAGCTHVACAGRPAWARAWGGRATGDIIMVRDI